MKLFSLVSCVLLAAADPCQEDHAITSEEGLSLIRDCWKLSGSVVFRFDEDSVLALPLLESVAKLTISGGGLKEIRLPSLIEADAVDITDAAALSTLEVPKLRQVGSFRLGRVGLQTLSFDGGLTRCQKFSVEDTLLEKIEGVKARTMAGFFLKGNLGLTAVSLARLESATKLSVSGMPGLVFEAPRLEKVRYLEITGTPPTDYPNIASIANLLITKIESPSLSLPFKTVLDRVTVERCDKLVSLGLADLESVGSELTVRLMPELTSLNLESLSEARSVDIGVSKLVSLDLSSASDSVGAISIEAPRLESLRLDELSELDELRIVSNQLTTLNLPSLTEADRLTVKGERLTALDLRALERVRQDLEIHAAGLVSLDLSSLRGVGTGLHVEAKDLESLDLGWLLYSCGAVSVQADKLSTVRLSSRLELHKATTFSSPKCSFTKIKKGEVTEQGACSNLQELSPVVKSGVMCRGYN